MGNELVSKQSRSNNFDGFIDFLIANNFLTDVTALQQITLAAKQYNVSLILYLIKYNLLDAKTVAIASAKYFGLQFIDLANYKPSDFSLATLNSQLIIKYRALPVGHHSSGCIELAIADPSNALALNAIKFHTAREIKPVVAEYDKLEQLIEILLKSSATSAQTLPSTPPPPHQVSQFLHPLLQQLPSSPAQILAQQPSVSPPQFLPTAPIFSPPLSPPLSPVAPTQDRSVIEMVDKLLARAIAQNASDIHFEPYENNYRVRLRIDGILYQEELLDINFAQRVGSRLKVMAKLDIAERRLPQDGRFTLNSGNPASATNSSNSSNSSKKNVSAKRDCRISTCPTMFGEKVVIRILNPCNMNLDVAQIGMTAPQQKVFLEQINASQGMILVTGPTGSGKTVSLYAALAALNTCEQNVSTVEDPIEINLPGVNQVEVNQKIGLNFAAVLRTFLRQDPDIIMVGEIRDVETAQIAIKAAQTGHLVLSTLHTNSAAETITRLINMEIAPFNLVGAIKLLIAQRLVRKLCPQCKEEAEMGTGARTGVVFGSGSGSGAGVGASVSADVVADVAASILHKHEHKHEPVSLQLPLPEQLLLTSTIFRARASGCECCKNGYVGRIAIFELLPISQTISKMILERRSSFEIEQQACREGMVNLRAAAWQRVLAGETSLEEINRVVL